MKQAVTVLVAEVLVTAIGILAFLRLAAEGFSARAEPTVIERFVARSAWSLAVPRGVQSRQNPAPNTREVLSAARAHWADHCATCHGNDGSGQVPILQSRQKYAKQAKNEKNSHTWDLTRMVS